MSKGSNNACSAGCVRVHKQAQVEGTNGPACHDYWQSWLPFIYRVNSTYATRVHARLLAVDGH